MGKLQIEALFGGVLALVVVAVVIAAVANTKLSTAEALGPAAPVNPDVESISFVAETGQDLICECYNKAFELAGSKVSVTSPDYRTGFEQCRARGGVDGGEAWTAGWTSRLDTDKPYESSCRAYKRRH